MLIDFLLQLNKKRSSFVGAFVSTHGRSIDDVDKSILEAKTALSEVTKDLTERSQRWRQVLSSCSYKVFNFNISKNCFTKTGFTCSSRAQTVQNVQRACSKPNFDSKAIKSYFDFVLMALVWLFSDRNALRLFNCLKSRHRSSKSACSTRWDRQGSG